MKTAEEWMKENYFDEESGTWLKFDFYETMEEYTSEQCQKRDELIKAQDELIKELCEEEGAVLYIKKLEDKIEELKKEIQNEQDTENLL